METHLAVQIAALAAPVVTAIFVTWFTARRQQNLSREERVESRRAKAYIEVADVVVRTRQYALTAFPGVDDDGPLRAPPIDDDQWWRIQALLEAYGSEAAVARFHQVLGEAAGVRTAVSHLEDVRQWSPPYDDEATLARRQAVDDLRDRRRRLKETTEEMLRLLNLELNGPGDRRRLVQALRAGAVAAAIVGSFTVGYGLGR